MGNPGDPKSKKPSLFSPPTPPAGADLEGPSIKPATPRDNPTDALFEAVIQNKKRESESQNQKASSDSVDWSKGTETGFLDEVVDFFSSRSTWLFAGILLFAATGVWGLSRMLISGLKAPAQFSEAVTKSAPPAGPRSPSDAGQKSPRQMPYRPNSAPSNARSKPAAEATAHAPVVEPPQTFIEAEEPRDPEPPNPPEEISDTHSKISDQEFTEENSDFVVEDGAGSAGKVTPAPPSPIEGGETPPTPEGE